jgi:hypothetical protein
MTTYTGRGGLATALRIKLMEVLSIPRIWQWFSILHSQVDTSMVADLGYSEGALPAREDLVSTLLSEHPLEQ